MWKERILYSLNDLSLELVTFFIGHPIMAGAMANNIEKNSQYITVLNIFLVQIFYYEIVLLIIQIIFLNQV